MSTKAIIFYDPSFPIIHAEGIEVEELARFGTVVGAEGLASALKGVEGGCFVNMHAPYFPKSAWNGIIQYLRNGGGLLSVGGAPFKRPVRHENGEWIVEAEQTGYHQELYIHEALKVDAAKVARVEASEAYPMLADQVGLFDIADTWNLVPHTTKNADLPLQMGSAGTMSTQITPLLIGKSADDRELSAPVVLWENSRGTFVGSRWIFIHMPLSASFWSQGGAAVIAKLAAFYGRGLTEISIKPNYANYEAGERPMLMLQTQNLQRKIAGTSAAVESWTFDLTLTRHDEETACWTHHVEAEAGSELQFVRIPVPVEIRSGFYQLRCEATSASGEVRVLRQGFWGHDAALLREGEPISANRDYFVKDGRPFPVVGMTYMTSDVARKFLFLPNVDVWDRDMAQMKKAGINWIRTGVWTAYRNIMQVDGHASEEVLRAIDAFILTAKRHDLQLTFTFFSFTPETWEGVNPYLDPQSVEAQKRFIRAIVSRHRDTANVDWDLINEPSMFAPEKIFSSGPRSAHDPYEREAYRTWLKERHGSIELLQERWNMSPAQLPSFDVVLPPEEEEINFDVQNMHQGKKGTRWLDYCLFSMEMHNRWAKALYDTIKDIVPNHLVTVGQDEALGAQRPSPFFYEEAVDYTTVHSWWLNDQLVWDGIFAKTANKPNVIQETGIMYVETPDGRAKRSELELRSILERKYAYAFSTGGAGAIQWIWNTNFYMDNANESHIGALRADGTEKPEADVSYDFGQFMNENRDLFEDRALEEIAVIFPYSNDFSNRKLAFDATTRITRVMNYSLKWPFRGVSEYHLEDLRANPAKLIVLPSAHNVDDQAMEQLVEIIKETGATLLITGPVGIGAYWQPSNRLNEQFGERTIGNVRREEMLLIGDKRYRVSFGQRRIAQLAKEVPSVQQAMDGDAIVEVSIGQGRILWSPLAVELNERDEAIEALYRYAAGQAGVSPVMEWLTGSDLPGVYGQKLAFKNGNLYVFVSEYAWDAPVEIKDPVSGMTYQFTLPAERSILFATDQGGQLVSTYRPQEVNIAVKGRY